MSATLLLLAIHSLGPRTFVFSQIGLRDSMSIRHDSQGALRQAMQEERLILTCLYFFE